MRTGNIYDLASYRAAKGHQATICQCCGDGPLVSVAEIDAGFMGNGVARHADHIDLCEWCGRTMVDEDNDRPNAPRSA